jgi:uncharacterized membrane protein YfbV (UPF0208 family)
MPSSTFIRFGYQPVVAVALRTAYVAYCPTYTSRVAQERFVTVRLVTRGLVILGSKSYTSRDPRTSEAWLQKIADEDAHRDMGWDPALTAQI